MILWCIYDIAKYHIKEVNLYCNTTRSSLGVVFPSKWWSSYWCL